MGISRMQFFTALGVVKHGPQIDGYTHQAYVDLEIDIWKNGRGNPHGHPWHTSFHGSQFPGADKSCGRKQIYTLMDTPNAEPAPPMLRATALMGQAAENQILYRWRKAGLLIAGEGPHKDGDPGIQLQFEDPDTWLTGSIDAVMGLPDFKYVLPCDVKSKSKDVIDQMKLGQIGYYPEHYAQVQAYLYLCDKFYDTMPWKELGFERPVGAIIYYVSRDNPRHTREFYVGINWEYINRALDNLRQWRADFETGRLPGRPKDWKWTEDPCKWCPFKKNVCKPDYKDGVTELLASHQIKFAETLKPTYSEKEVREEVMKRWLTTEL